MKISRRTKNGWREESNESKTHCDKCSKKLWVSPSNKLYCDTPECADTPVSLNQKQAIKRILDTFEYKYPKVLFLCNWLEDINWHDESAELDSHFPDLMQKSDIVFNRNSMYNFEVRKAREAITGFTAIFGYGLDDSWNNTDGSTFVMELIDLMDSK